MTSGQTSKSGAPKAAVPPKSQNKASSAASESGSKVLQLSKGKTAPASPSPQKEAPNKKRSREEDEDSNEEGGERKATNKATSKQKAPAKSNGKAHKTEQSDSESEKEDQTVGSALMHALSDEDEESGSEGEDDDEDDDEEESESEEEEDNDNEDAESEGEDKEGTESATEPMNEDEEEDSSNASSSVVTSHIPDPSKVPKYWFEYEESMVHMSEEEFKKKLSKYLEGSANYAEWARDVVVRFYNIKEANPAHERLALSCFPIQSKKIYPDKLHKMVVEEANPQIRSGKAKGAKDYIQPFRLFIVKKADESEERIAFRLNAPSYFEMDPNKDFTLAFNQNMVPLLLSDVVKDLRKEKESEFSRVEEGAYYIVSKDVAKKHFPARQADVEAIIKNKNLKKDPKTGKVVGFMIAGVNFELFVKNYDKKKKHDESTESSNGNGKKKKKRSRSKKESETAKEAHEPAPSAESASNKQPPAKKAKVSSTSSPATPSEDSSEKGKAKVKQIKQAKSEGDEEERNTKPPKKQQSQQPQPNAKETEKNKKTESKKKDPKETEKRTLDGGAIGEDDEVVLISSGRPMDVDVLAALQNEFKLESPAKGLEPGEVWKEYTDLSVKLSTGRIKANKAYPAHVLVAPWAGAVRNGKKRQNSDAIQLMNRVIKSKETDTEDDKATRKIAEDIFMSEFVVRDFGANTAPGPFALKVAAYSAFDLADEIVKKLIDEVCEKQNKAFESFKEESEKVLKRALERICTKEHDISMLKDQLEISKSAEETKNAYIKSLEKTVSLLLDSIHSSCENNGQIAEKVKKLGVPTSLTDPSLSIPKNSTAELESLKVVAKKFHELVKPPPPPPSPSPSTKNSAKETPQAPAAEPQNDESSNEKKRKRSGSGSSAASSSSSTPPSSTSSSSSKAKTSHAAENGVGEETPPKTKSSSAASNHTASRKESPAPASAPKTTPSSSSSTSKSSTGSPFLSMPPAVKAVDSNPMMRSLASNADYDNSETLWDDE